LSKKGNVFEGKMIEIESGGGCGAGKSIVLFNINEDSIINVSDELFEK